MLGALEHRAKFDGVCILEGTATFAAFFDEVFEGAADFFLVFEADFSPHLSGAAGDAGEVFEAGADEIQRMRAVAADDVDDGGGNDVWEMADPGDDFVVFLRRERADLAAE